VDSAVTPGASRHAIDLPKLALWMRRHNVVNPLRGPRQLYVLKAGPRIAAADALAAAPPQGMWSNACTR
jgi:hypothetical protein